MPLPAQRRTRSRKIGFAALLLVLVGLVNWFRHPSGIPLSPTSETAIGSELGNIIKANKIALPASTKERTSASSGDKQQLILLNDQSRSTAESIAILEHDGEAVGTKKTMTSMHSHHSHSGDYVMHAKDHLEDIVLRAIEMGFTTYCLTEHIPRNNPEDMYPEEVCLSSLLSSLFSFELLLLNSSVLNFRISLL